jgi:hypothetical protein
MTSKINNSKTKQNKTTPKKKLAYENKQAAHYIMGLPFK